MMELGTVASLWRYPVKSLRGERLEVLAFDARGAEGDRLWALRDEAGKLGSGKTTRRFRQMDGLFALGSRLEGELPVIAFPDGRSLRGDAPGLDAALSSHVGLPVRLSREADVRHHDTAPLHLVTSASLRAVAGWRDGPIDARRFRPNLVIDGELLAFAEDGWLGRTLGIGPALRVRLTKRTERCRMVGLAQDELPEDVRLLKELGQRNAACFGVYAEILVPGSVRRGDPVFLA